MKYLLLFLPLFCLCAGASADETWLEVSPSYAKPFHSPGYAGGKADGLGITLGFESWLTQAWAVGLSYEQMKVDEQQADPGYFGFATASLRWAPMEWDGVRPYALVQIGALTQSQSNQPVESRPAGLDSQAGLGVLLTSGQPWAVDLGLSALTVGSGDGLNMLQAHAGLAVRFGMPAATSD